MKVDHDHRLSCSQNHTSTHILNSALRNILPYTSQRSSYVGPSHLHLGFSAKTALTLDQLESIEDYLNSVVQMKHKVSRELMMFEELLNNPNAVLLRGEEYPEKVSVIIIGTEENTKLISVEPCCGTHVHSTGDIEKFILIPTKSSHSGSTRIISAATGKCTKRIEESSKETENMTDLLKVEVDTCLKDVSMPLETYQSLLKRVKKTLRETQLKNDISLIKQKKCESILQEVKLKLNDIIQNISRTDMEPQNEYLTNRKPSISPNILHSLKSSQIPTTKDVFKYHSFDAAKPLKAEVLVVVQNDNFATAVKRGLSCQLVLNKTNFYSEADDQACDEGRLLCEDFAVKINNVYKIDGYVFHDGFVEEGTVVPNRSVKMLVNEGHRLACSQNHTALHLLNAVLKTELPYYFPRFAEAGPSRLLLAFSSKKSISDDQLQRIEGDVNDCIRKNSSVIRTEESLESWEDIPLYKAQLIKEFDKTIPSVTIGSSNEVISKEPCCGTHVSTTSDIGSFIIISQNSNKNREKVIRAVTGKKADEVREDGDTYEKSMIKLEEYTTACLNDSKVNVSQLWDCLKELKIAKGFHEAKLPVLMFRRHQAKLSELTNALTEATNSFVQEGFKQVKCEMEDILKNYAEKEYIIHKLSSVGDGKKIINYAIEKSLDKPALYFALDGSKSVICTCSVPKSLVSPDFSALLWINPVASVLEGSARALAKDPELLYSVVSGRVDRIDHAMEIANEFVDTNLGIK